MTYYRQIRPVQSQNPGQTASPSEINLDTLTSSLKTFSEKAAEDRKKNLLQSAAGKLASNENLSDEEIMTLHNVFEEDAASIITQSRVAGLENILTQRMQNFANGSDDEADLAAVNLAKQSDDPAIQQGAMQAQEQRGTSLAGNVLRQLNISGVNFEDKDVMNVVEKLARHYFMQDEYEDRSHRAEDNQNVVDILKHINLNNPLKHLLSADNNAEKFTKALSYLPEYFRAKHLSVLSHKGAPHILEIITEKGIGAAIEATAPILGGDRKEALKFVSDIVKLNAASQLNVVKELYVSFEVLKKVGPSIMEGMKEEVGDWYDFTGPRQSEKKPNIKKMVDRIVKKDPVLSLLPEELRESYSRALIVNIKYQLPKFNNWQDAVAVGVTGALKDFEAKNATELGFLRGTVYALKGIIDDNNIGGGGL